MNYDLVLSIFRLISVRGVGGKYPTQIEFQWALITGTVGPLLTTINTWSFLPGNSPVFRRASTGQPQCLSIDGVNCQTSWDGFNLRMCGEDALSSTSGLKLLTCTEADGATDLNHWCKRARGALGKANLRCCSNVNCECLVTRLGVPCCFLSTRRSCCQEQQLAGGIASNG
jgi:hypothetical protein